jgi:hypothetical protein
MEHQIAAHKASAVVLILGNLMKGVYCKPPNASTQHLSSGEAKTQNNLAVFRGGTG